MARPMQRVGSYYEVAITLTRMVSVPTAGVAYRVTSQPYARRDGVVELLIDAKAILANLGPKALRNRSRKTHLAGGAVVVQVVRSTDTPIKQTDAED